MAGAALAGCGDDPSRVPAVDDDAPGHTYRVYFLGGQSNMDGYGHVDALPAALSRLTPGVRIFTGRTHGDNQAGGGVGTWVALGPGHGTGFRTDEKAVSLSGRFGPELSFGRTMAELDPGARVAIVKYSMGGTGLSSGVGYGNWDPDFGAGAGINQYDHALATIRNALGVADVDGDGRRDELIPSGIVWMQGEADAHHSQAAADRYGAQLRRLMDLLRAALRRDDLPVVIGKITDSGMDEDGQVMHYIDTVQRAQSDFARSDACAAYVTVTDGLTFSDDAWHYDSQGYVLMGEAFARAMFALRERCRAGP